MSPLALESISSQASRIAQIYARCVLELALFVAAGYFVALLSFPTRIVALREEVVVSGCPVLISNPIELKSSEQTSVSISRESNDTVVIVVVGPTTLQGDSNWAVIRDSNGLHNCRTISSRSSMSPQNGVLPFLMLHIAFLGMAIFSLSDADRRNAILASLRRPPDKQTVLWATGGLLALLMFQLVLADVWLSWQTDVTAKERIIQASPFVVVLVAPIVEESWFRGTLLRKIQEAGYPLVGAILSTVLFMAIHGITLDVHVAVMRLLIIGILGSILAWTYLRTKSLTACICIHVMNNGCAILLGGN